MTKAQKATEPLYVQVADRILSRVMDGEFPVGCILPREIDLSEELEVSRNTVRSAMAILENQGIVKRRRRSGTEVVNARRPQTFGFDISSIEGIRLYIRSTTATVVDNSDQELPDDLAQMGNVGIRKGWRRISAVRRMHTSKDPIASIEIYLHPKFAATAEKYGTTNQLHFQHLERDHNVKIDRIDVILRPTIVGEHWAGQLNCDPTLPAINMIELIYSVDGEVVELASMMIPQNRMEFVFSLPAQR